MSPTHTACPVCGHRDAAPFYGFGIEATRKIRVENQVCKQCGAVHLASPPSMDSLLDFYAEYQGKTVSETIDVPLFYEENTFAKDRFRADFLTPHIKKGCRFLDLGCGIGAQLRVLADRYGDDVSLTGINPEPGPVNHAREHYGVNSMVGMFEDVEFAPGSFDMVFMDNVFEHFLNPREQLGRLHEVLDDNGKLVLFTDNVATLRGFPWQNLFPEHIVTYSPTTLRAQLESTGFSVEVLDTNGHVTSEGFHWPYISCVATKTDKPDSYDFRRNGEDYRYVIDRLTRHTGAWYQNNMWAKKLFDLESGPMDGLRDKALRAVYRTLARLNNQPAHHLPNHTLPPLAYHQRRAVLIHADTAQDDKLGIDLVMRAGLNPEYVVVTDNGHGLTIAKATPFIRTCCNNAIPGHLATESEVWAWLDETLPGLARRMSLDIRRAALSPGQEDDLLKRLATGKDCTIAIHGGTVTASEQ